MSNATSNVYYRLIYGSFDFAVKASRLRWTGIKLNFLYQWVFDWVHFPLVNVVKKFQGRPYWL